jgi:putative FmdB family regulatory protein
VVPLVLEHQPDLPFPDDRRVPRIRVPGKPEYDYKCEGCGHSFTVRLGIKEHDAANIKCPMCKFAKAPRRIASFIVTMKKNN